MKVYLIIILIFISCGPAKEKEYTYVEKFMKTEYSGTSPQDAKPLLIKAVSDSDAYMKSYFNFRISHKAYNQEFEKSGTIAGKPVSFKILNDKGVDITNNINFLYKDSLEKKIKNRLNKIEIKTDE